MEDGKTSLSTAQLGKIDNSRCIFYLLTEHSYAADSQQTVADVAFSEALRMETAEESQEKVKKDNLC